MFYEWTGRDDGNVIGKRIHQVVRNINVDNIKKTTDTRFAIVGFECEEGVRRNQGRLGAAKGPNQIRLHLASIPYHTNETNLIDIGNVACIGTELEKAQQKLGDYVAKLLEHQYTPIILGGGHETFYGHYLGVRKALGPNKKIGLINLDAHFDLRNDTKPSSGTMFRQILEKDEYADYLCVGLQKLGNTEELFNTAKDFNVKYILETDLIPLEATFDKINKFALEQDVVMYSICTDVINQAFAPGVSAPAPFGIHPDIVRVITKHVVNLDNFISFDVSEVNPTFDVVHKTSRLIAYIVAEVLMHLNDKEKSLNLTDKQGETL